VSENFLDRMDRELIGWSAPVERLRAALDGDELVLYCQPIRALNATAGAEPYPMAEVLVRMRSEENSLLPPGEFLPVFEHFRMMPDLDRWVVRTIAAHLKRDARIPRYTVNLSGQTLEDSSFAAYVAEQVAVAAIAPSALLFEIDEADVLSRPRAAERLGAALRRVGSGTLIDGFGRRAASFAPLKTMQVEFIKVDGAITRRVCESKSAETKMKAIVHVGQALGMGIIAECVEEQHVLARLTSLGAGYAQGFGISRPQPLQALSR
jgi:EAL domain-containing protein (putative c-di-GMP-specific phosphodiesterase class I)